MSHRYSRSPDDHRRPSDASLSGTWYSNEDNTAATSARPTYRTGATEYSNNPEIEYIPDDHDILHSRYVDSAYRDQPSPQLAEPPYPDHDDGADVPSGIYHPSDAFLWMTGDKQSGDDLGMMGSLEALPSTTPPQYISQEPTTEPDPRRGIYVFEPENKSKGKETQRQKENTARAHHNSGYGPGASNLGAQVMFHEAHTYGSGGHFLVNASAEHHASGITTQHNFSHQYPDHIDENDLYGFDRTMEADDLDWEMVCIHGYSEHCPFYCQHQT
ncbi:hypothetical protein QBC41DRAFT_60773 [Cercophora samala]|uniref:Uncharacterized protein n=1 Tax=Cercophora samala TaxID=330535 RepID=A0AA39ZHN6_9PEZI|nr:hypothetical protein QBC41DRAFT_60773 [Cercophora samala]